MIDRLVLFSPTALFTIHARPAATHPLDIYMYVAHPAILKSALGHSYLYSAHLPNASQCRASLPATHQQRLPKAAMIQHEMQPHRPQDVRTLPPPQARVPRPPLPHNGSCLVILPYSRSAFRGTYFNAPDQEVNTCECTSFFMSPGDPEACLCGHPARYHGPGPRQPAEGELDAGSSDGRPRSRAADILAAGGPGTYVPPVPLFPQPYSARRKSSPLSAAAPESNQSPRASTGVSSPVYQIGRAHV